MTDRQIIVPDGMRLIYERAGYAPTVKALAQRKSKVIAGHVSRFVKSLAQLSR